MTTRLDIAWDIPIDFSSFIVHENCIYSECNGWIDYNNYGKTNVMDTYCEIFHNIEKIQRPITNIPWNPPYLDSHDEASRKDISNGPEYILNYWLHNNNINLMQSQFVLEGRSGLSLSRISKP